MTLNNTKNKKKVVHVFGNQKTFPDINDGQILYDVDEKSLYIDALGERNKINSQNYWTVLPSKTIGYGVQWDYSNPSTKLTRIGEAAGLADPSPATSIYETGSSPFDEIYPWCDMREVNILNDGTILEKDDSEFSYDNDTMVWIPEFWYKVTKDEVAKTHTWIISATEEEGFKKHPGSGKYVGRYHTGVDEYYASIDDKYYWLAYSRTGLNPDLNDSVGFQGYVYDKGEHWWILDISVWSAIQMLYLVEFADWNSKVTLGTGLGGDVNSLSEYVSGGTDTAMYHTICANNNHNQYRYIEDIIGAIPNYVDGYKLAFGNNYITCNQQLYTSPYQDWNEHSTTMKYTEQPELITEFYCNDNVDFMFIPCNSAQITDDNLSNYVTDIIYVNPNADESTLDVGGINESTGMFVFYASDYEYSLSPGSRLIYDGTATFPTRSEVTEV